MEGSRQSDRYCNWQLSNCSVTAGYRMMSIVAKDPEHYLDIDARHEIYYIAL